MPGKTFTGIKRTRTTRTSVKVADLLSRIFITAAGMGTILAVSLVCIFLVAVVWPLFPNGEVTSSTVLQAPVSDTTAQPIHIEVDEYQTMACAIYPDTTAKIFRLDTGEVVDTKKIITTGNPTCWSFGLRGGDVAFGFEDGRIQFGSLTFKTSYLELKDMDVKHRAMKMGELATLDNGVVEVTPLGQFRLQQLTVDLKDPIDLKSNSPVKLIDLSMLTSGPVFATITADGMFRINSVREIRNIVTRKVTYQPSGGQVQIPQIKTSGMPSHLVVEGRGDSAMVVWKDGKSLRIDTRDKATPQIAEQLDLTPDDDAQIAKIDTLIGKMTLVVGDSKGHVSTWFRVKPEAVATTKDGHPVVRAHDLHPPVASRLRSAQASELVGDMAATPSDWMVCETPDASVLVHQYVLPTSREGQAVTALASSKRNRMIAVGYADGHFDLIYVTSERLLAQHQVSADGKPVASITMSPKNDGLLAASGSQISMWNIKVPHPETTPAAIFTPVWYEGSLKPEQVWQSSAGDDAFEPKYGLYPLVFGTLKATFYSMLFGVPIALLAAIHTSEFLHPRTKARIKPTVEIMASLPSVVLGFLAALVFAPIIEDIVTAVLLIFFVVPSTVVLCSFIWQLVPAHLVMKLNRYRLLMIILTLPLGFSISMSLAGVVENVLFGGDIRGWLAWKPSLIETKPSDYASPIGGWFMLLLPFTALVMTFFVVTFVNPFLRTRTMTMERSAQGMFHLIKFIVGSLLAIALSYVLGAILSALGLDPRGSIVDTYIQRNALIVGFIMGFAVIPIIYTLAEDALSSVPDHLRAASLGAGATRWQTAIRIIIPTAMSGVFSAVMIGLGRAVGETMIVLMAAGNTPIMDLNMFSGFRTLSANIAVELPESVQHGTHYRMLFLAALSLFVMTFILNTVAEVVRLRFRKRAFQL